MALSSTERLVIDLIGAGAPRDMVAAARKFAFHDFKSPSATPCIDLVLACDRYRLETIGERARNGEYDATRKEADEWMRSEDGRKTLSRLATGK